MDDVTGNLFSLFCSTWHARSQIHPNFFPQSVIKSEMKIELRMEGTVNGHKFVITGKGTGQPFE